MQCIKKKCLSCKKEFIAQRNPAQQYCAQAACQQFRRSQWRRRKKSADADYRANQQAANQRWQERRRDYWRKYRSMHADYVRRNREQQHQRDQRDAAKARFNLAKRDALLKKSPENIENSIILSGTYEIVPVTEPKKHNLAKRDALRVKITFISKG
jgi:hypothetical protein